ncbi:hypothetical protein [Nostoc sp.]|uniref:hypothetical protein n=1 Tax=Nostoc sp. TaxID=1180 RepID=UPI002FF4EEF8
MEMILNCLQIWASKIRQRFSVGEQCGEAVWSSPYSPSPKGDAPLLRSGILRRALASPNVRRGDHAAHSTASTLTKAAPTSARPLHVRTRTSGEPVVHGGNPHEQLPLAQLTAKYQFSKIRLRYNHAKTQIKADFLNSELR